jgi:hypothetical protein
MLLNDKFVTTENRTYLYKTFLTKNNFRYKILKYGLGHDLNL